MILFVTCEWLIILHNVLNAESTFNSDDGAS